MYRGTTLRCPKRSLGITVPSLPTLPSVNNLDSVWSAVNDTRAAVTNIGTSVSTVASDAAKTASQVSALTSNTNALVSQLSKKITDLEKTQQTVENAAEDSQKSLSTIKTMSVIGAALGATALYFYLKKK